MSSSEICLLHFALPHDKYLFFLNPAFCIIVSSPHSHLHFSIECLSPFGDTLSGASDITTSLPFFVPNFTFILLFKPKAQPQL